MDPSDTAENGNGHTSGEKTSVSTTCSAPTSGDPNGPVPKRARTSIPITRSEILSEFSHHDQAVARVNNGSFGSCPASVLRAQAHYQNLFLSQPDAFYFRTLQPALRRSRFSLLPYIGASDPSTVSLVDNATTAAAIVLQHVAWQFNEGQFNKGDTVLMLHYAYGAVKKSIHAYVARAGAHVIEVPLSFPVSSKEEILCEFRKSIELGKSNGRRVRLAVIDHITSMPSVVLPVHELVQICRSEGVDRVFIDGAHAIGNVRVDVDSIGADYYTSNLHKWFFCPPAVAFLHSHVKKDLHHPVVSHEYGNGLPMESGWIGTRDYSPQLVIPDAIDFVERFEGGIDGIRERNHENVLKMGEMLAEAWGTRLGTPREMCCSMAMVGLPPCLGIRSDADAMRLRDLLRDEYKIEVPIYYNSRVSLKDGEIMGYVRISYQVYNTDADYFRLRDVVNKLVKDGFSCATLDPTSSNSS